MELWSRNNNFTTLSSSETRTGLQKPEVAICVDNASICAVATDNSTDNSH